MNETGKSAIRRGREPAFIQRYFRGVGIDIGAGGDPLSNYAHLFPFVERVIAWDQPQGDAQLMRGVENNTFDFVHSSHCLEHLHDPVQALARWVDIVKPGGYVIVTVPDEDMYEKGLWPSRFNSDHKVSFTVGKPKDAPAPAASQPASRLPCSINMLDLMAVMIPVASCERLVLVRDFYDDRRPNVDQTAEGVAECAIEFVLRKRDVAAS